MSEEVHIVDMSKDVVTLVEAPPGGTLHITPGGYRIALRNPAVLRVRDRKVIMSKVDSTNPGESFVDMLNTVLIALIVEWDLRRINDLGQAEGDVLPISLDALDDMPLVETAGLDEVAQAGLKIVMPDFSPNSSEASPTRPSAG